MVMVMVLGMVLVPVLVMVMVLVLVLVLDMVMVFVVISVWIICPKSCHRRQALDQCCGFKHIKFGRGSTILAQFGSGSGSMVMV